MQNYYLLHLWFYNFSLGFLLHPSSGTDIIRCTRSSFHGLCVSSIPPLGLTPARWHHAGLETSCLWKQTDCNVLGNIFSLWLPCCYVSSNYKGVLARCGFATHRYGRVECKTWCCIKKCCCTTEDFSCFLVKCSYRALLVLCNQTAAFSWATAHRRSRACWGSVFAYSLGEKHIKEFK